MTGTPRDVELAAVVDQDTLLDRADRWTVLARSLAQIHDDLSPDVPELADIWVGAAADAFFARLGPLLAAISRLAEQMLLVKGVLVSVQEDTTPVRRALYRDVIGWQRDLAGIAADERADPSGRARFQAQRDAVTDRWAARAQAAAAPLTDTLAAGAATLAAIDPVTVPLPDPD
ncbi:MAG TPA: hypothetical protein VFW65_11325 [Pseudonocardiaceae bacterium]|nr:hypothetical protein [Pseudonocardiaceae bacterium]